MKPFFLVFFFSFFLSSCSLIGEKPAVYYQPSRGIALADGSKVKEALRIHYEKWQGTPYQQGGMDLSGVDCSGFTQITYHQLFGLRIGRSTEDQLQQGTPIGLGSLRPGDLVFFKTGFFKSHVGIYLDKGLFLHASASKGVTVSTLKLTYWYRNFLTARTFRAS